MHANVGDWFGKSLSEFDVRRMLCSCLVGDSIVLTCSKSLRCYRAEDPDSEELSIVDFADVAANDVIVPIVQFAGLSISSRHFTPSFSLRNVVVVDRKVVEEEEPEAPFFLSKGEEEEEIIDPFSYFAREDAMSQKSFETQAWH